LNRILQTQEKLKKMFKNQQTPNLKTNPQIAMNWLPFLLQSIFSVNCAPQSTPESLTLKPDTNSATQACTAKPSISGYIVDVSQLLSTALAQLNRLPSS